MDGSWLGLNVPWGKFGIHGTLDPHSVGWASSHGCIRMNNDEQIVIIRGQKPFKCKKLRYWEYRLGKDINQISIENYKPKTTYKLVSIEEKEEIQKLPTFEEFLKGRRKTN